MSEEASPSRLPEEAWGRVPDLGIPQLDQQHRRIMQALVRLDECLHRTYPKSALEDRIHQLRILTTDHFRDEEELMAQAGYPHLGPHRAEHEVLLIRCHEMLEFFGSPGAPPSRRLAETLAEVFMNHIENVDREYAEYMAQARAQAAEWD